jgi:signal transduction histidine kinase
LTHSERIRIAQELHDGIAQDLVALSYSLDLLLAQSETPSTTRVELRTLIFSVSSMIEKVRTEIYELRSEPIATFENSLRAVLSDLRSSIELHIDQTDYILNHDVEREILAISIELLRNAVKHSGASVIEISIQKSDTGYTYLYKDNGKGIDPLQSLGYGLRGIQERCSSIESELTMVSNELGTHFVIAIPL